MIEFFSSLNYLAIFVASLSSFVIGALWFGPKTFYPVWMKAMGREVPTERIEMKAGETLLMFGGTYVGALVQIVSLALIMAMAEAAGVKVSALDGAIFGLVFSVGIGAFSSFGHRMFAAADHKVYRSLKVWILEVGQDAAALVVAGAILAAWH
mgnify:FL=1|jgi:hypothetical protein